MELQNKGLGCGHEVRWSAALCAIAGASLGAAVVYFWDPSCGKLRRAMLRDKAASAARKAQHGAAKRTEDFLNRAKGVISQADAGLAVAESVVSDDLVEERVRSRLGHIANHVQDIYTEVSGGVLTLRGTVATGQHRNLVDSLLRIPGVRGVRDLLVTGNREAVCES